VALPSRITTAGKIRALWLMFSSARGLRGGNVTGGRNTVVRIIGAQVCNRRIIARPPGAGFSVAIFRHKSGDKNAINTLKLLTFL
jgi:hypothetical protein